MTTRPIDDGGDEGILWALARLVRDLPSIDVVEAHRRLGGLTVKQQEVISGAFGSRLASAFAGAEPATGPFSAKTAAELQRLEDEEGCLWQITLAREGPNRIPEADHHPSSARGLTWKCVLRCPTRIMRAQGPSAEEAMRAALRQAGAAEVRLGDTLNVN